MLSKTAVKQRASQVASLPATIRGEGLLGEGVKPPSLCVSVQSFVESICREFLVPRTKARQFVGRQPFDGFLNLFNCHVANIARMSQCEKHCFAVEFTCARSPG